MKKWINSEIYMEFKKIENIDITTETELLKLLQIDSFNQFNSLHLIPFEKIGSFYNLIAGKVITKDTFSKLTQFFKNVDEEKNSLIIKEFQLDSTISVIILIDQPEFLFDSDDLRAYSFLIIDVPEKNLLINNKLNINY
jgi:hypothetical protein